MYKRFIVFQAKKNWICNIQLLYGFRVWMAWSKHEGMLRELRKARETDFAPFS
jgi:hypothetical protein